MLSLLLQFWLYLILVSRFSWCVMLQGLVLALSLCKLTGQCKLLKADGGGRHKCVADEQKPLPAVEAVSVLQCSL